MTFEPIIKGRQASKIPHRHISVGTQGTIRFSKDFSKLLTKYFGIELMIDEEKQLLQFILSNDEDKAYKIYKRGKFQIPIGFFCYKIRSLMKGGHYPARFNGGKITIKYEKLK